MNAITEILTKEWIKAFGRNPRLTSMVSIAIIAVLVLTVSLVDKADHDRREALRQQSLSYEAQITELDKMEASLHALTDFMQEQKTKLKESEDIVASLKTEQERLKPVVEADRKAIQAVFDLQDERNRAGIWRERWVGFAFGVLASLVASFVYGIVAYAYKRRVNPGA